MKLRAAYIALLYTCLVQSAMAGRLLMQSKQLAVWQQCGGWGSCNCPPEIQCGDVAWPGINCEYGHDCVRLTELYWQCRPPLLPVSGWQQCGGASCDSSTKQPPQLCSDKIWGQCPSGFSCYRRNQFYYQCRPSDRTPAAPADWDLVIPEFEGNSVTAGSSGASSSTTDAASSQALTDSLTAAAMAANQASSSSDSNAATLTDPDTPVIQEVDASVVERLAGSSSSSSEPAQRSMPQVQPAYSTEQQQQQQPEYVNAPAPLFGFLDTRAMQRPQQQQQTAVPLLPFLPFFG